MSIMTKTMAVAAVLSGLGLSAGAVAADGEQGFKFYCAQCHGHNLVGGMA